MKISRQTTFFVMIIAALLFCYPLAVTTTDSKILANQINKDLRQAERLMFSGKKMESDTLLQQVNEKLKELKGIDSSSKVKNLENKYSKTRTALDKRMDGGTLSPSVSKAPKMNTATVQHGSNTAVQSVPRGGYKQQMMEKNIKKAVKDVDYEIVRAKEMMVPDNTNNGFVLTADEKTAKASGYLAKAEQHLVKVEKKYTDLSPEAQKQFTVARRNIAETAAALNSWQKDEQTKGKIAAGKAATAADAATEKTTAMKHDAELITVLHKKYYGAFEKIHGGSLVYSMNIDEAQQALALVAEAKKTIPLFASDIGRLAEQYGKSSMNIYNTFHKGGYTLENGEDQKLSQLIEVITKIKKSRQASAVTLAGNAKVLLSAFNNQLNDARIKRMGEAKNLLLVGQQFDPKNTQIIQMLAEIDGQMEQVADKMTTMIDAAIWADNVTGFAGPGDVAVLAAEARKYFENDRAWGGKKDSQIQILDVCIRGPWKIAETDVFGRVISWRLPIHVAVTDKKLKPRNMARVYDLSILALQGPAGKAPKKPPFDGFWVGDSWMMRLNKF